MTSVFLNSTDLQEGGDKDFVCDASEIGLERGCFPPAIDADSGNQAALRLEGPIFGPYGKELGIAYRQERSGIEVLVLFDWSRGPGAAARLFRSQGVDEASALQASSRLGMVHHGEEGEERFEGLKRSI